MKNLKSNFLLLLVVALLLAACGGDEADNGGDMMDGDDIGSGMMDEDQDMMGDEGAGDMMDDDAGMMDEGAMMGDETAPDRDNMGSGEMMEGTGVSGMGEGEIGGSGTAWGDGAFAGNGERIYFTGTSERSGDIDYTGGPDIGGMMMSGQLSCASCHGPNARGGEHRMHMEIMDAPNIRWDVLAEHGDGGHEEGEDAHTEEEGDHAEEDDHADEEAGYDLETFRLAVVAGTHPDGEPLSEEMPRWQMSDADLRDLAAHLQSLEGE